VALEAILELLDCDIVRAGSGTAALKELLQNDFALILMDVQMPGLDGFETASIIKERERTRHIPIIFVTALSTKTPTSSKAIRPARSITFPSRTTQTFFALKSRSS